MDISEAKSRLNKKPHDWMESHRLTTILLEFLLEQIQLIDDRLIEIEHRPLR